MKRSQGFCQIRGAGAGQRVVYIMQYFHCHGHKRHALKVVSAYSPMKCVFDSASKSQLEVPPLFILFLYRRRKHLFLSTLLVLLDSVKPLKRDTIVVSDGNNIRGEGKVGAPL